MTVKELIEELEEFPENMEVINNECYLVSVVDDVLIDDERYLLIY